MESRGSPNFKVAGKTFAIYVINHHGDGRVALWLEATHDAQMLYSEMEPEYYFVPPYVGHNGWIDLDVENDVDWGEAKRLILESYRHFALKRMLQKLELGMEEGR